MTQFAVLPRALHDGVLTGVCSSVGLALRAVAVVNGLVGDRLEVGRAQPARAMSLRVDGHDVEPGPAALAAAFPRAAHRVLVFVPGVGADERHWDVRRHEMGGTYGSRLEAAAGWTPVYLRVNAGPSVAECGVALTSLMQQLLDNWPVEVRRVAMVGHSTGGLIVRAACAVDTERAQPWNQRLSDVVSLGTPQVGADTFRGLPELPARQGVRYRLVSNALRPATATRGALRLFPDAEALHVPGADRLTLLNHPDVYRALATWLA